MSTKLKPLGDKIVLKKIETEEKTASGIVLPGSAKEDSQIAEVIAIGPGTEKVTIEVKIGDKVIASKYSGTEIKIDDDDLNIVSQKDILAIVK
ncbi:MAG: co-chaperone GroES [Clostridiales Family XIII bacterium]|jgi:chaperonin GroES|nr:co-chaperone GroES [Clostridiales Family XIII bacterium]